jgi:diguanylate cyclase (GGDEF)-like protein
MQNAPILASDLLASDLASRAQGARGPGWWRIGELRHATERVAVRRIAALWLTAVLASVATGILNVTLAWNGIALELFGLPVDITLYPPFLVSVVLVLWLGPTWAGIPIYLANLASALASGMPPAMAALFAVAGVVETLMLWGSLVLLRVDPDLGRWRDAAWFLGASFVAAVTGSLAAILWNASHQLDPTAGARVWRGWVIGDLSQILLLAPVFRLFGRRARSWIDRQFVTPPQHDFSYTHGVGLVVAAFAILGMVVFLGVHQALGSIAVALDTRTADGALLLPRLREIVLVMGLLSTALIVATGMFSTALARMGERQRREAQVDSLTGCYNRRSFDLLLAREGERSRRLGLGLGLLMLDLDHFKRLNDAYGHGLGDEVLVRFVRAIEEAVRQTDLVFRWGGEEFVVMLPHTSREEAAAVAERVRARIAKLELPLATREARLQLTTSVGVSWTDRFPADGRTLVELADAACYQAKAAGRNRVVHAA